MALIHVLRTAPPAAPAPHRPPPYQPHRRKEWDAASYHKVAAPQTAWGRRVLVAADRQRRRARHRCRLRHRPAHRRADGDDPARPADRDRSLVEHADHGASEPAAGFRRPRRVRARRAAAAALRRTGPIWSSAPPRSIGCAITRRCSPRSCARCGRAAGSSRSAAAAPTCAEAHALAETVMHREPFAPYFDGWDGVWEFATPEVTADRLRAAGFVDIATNLEAAPTTLADEASYREFVTTVIYNPHLARLPDPALRARSSTRSRRARRDRIRRSRSTTGGSTWKDENHDAPECDQARRARRLLAREDGQVDDLRSERLLVGPQRFRARPESRAARACRAWTRSTQSSRAKGVFLLDGRELPMRAGDLLVAPEGVPHGVRNTGTEGCWCSRSSRRRREVA